MKYIISVVEHKVILFMSNPVPSQISIDNHHQIFVSRQHEVVPHGCQPYPLLREVPSLPRLRAPPETVLLSERALHVRGLLLLQGRRTQGPGIFRRRLGREQVPNLQRREHQQEQAD